MTIGSAEGFSDFAAFDGAPPAAGMGNAGLLTMSSILPLRPRSGIHEPASGPARGGCVRAHSVGRVCRGDLPTGTAAALRE
ncbi:MAG: hypothetical protein KBI48_05125 [Deltaproteobacteria bacterium]|nr:hypothetical protein [Deltaproteobacteria bacterium]